MGRTTESMLGKQYNLRHGHCPTVDGKTYPSPTYRTWKAMKNRCKGKPGYADRGITVCVQWERFENFLADMGERPAGTTLDRIDNDGNYEPGNCRWATASEQQRNKRPQPNQPNQHTGRL